MDLSNEIETIRSTETVIESATVFINGSADRTEAAVEAALAKGATEAELAPLRELVTETRAKADELASAIAANTPGAPTEV